MVNSLLGRISPGGECRETRLGRSIEALQYLRRTWQHWLRILQHWLRILLLPPWPVQRDKLQRNGLDSPNTWLHLRRTLQKLDGPQAR